MIPRNNSYIYIDSSIFKETYLDVKTPELLYYRNKIENGMRGLVPGSQIHRGAEVGQILPQRLKESSGKAEVRMRDH